MNYGRRIPAVLMLVVLTAGIAIAEGTMTGAGKAGDRSNTNAAGAIAHERENWIRPHVLRPDEEKAGSPSRKRRATPAATTTATAGDSYSRRRHRASATENQRARLSSRQRLEVRSPTARKSHRPVLPQGLTLRPRW